MPILDRRIHPKSARITAVLLLFAMLSGCFVGTVRAADTEISGLVRTNGRCFCLEDGSEYVIHGIAFENDVFSDSAEPPTGHNNADSYLELAELGFNTVRYYLNYRVLESDDVPYEYLETGFAWLDENVKWAKDAGIRLLLNLHFPQGGYQSQGEGDSLWTDRENQKRFTALWQEIARRYADEPAILGYGLVNEPRPVGETDAHDGLRVWQQLAQETVDAIREIDRNHIIFIEKAEGTKDPSTGEMLWEFKGTEQYIEIEDDNYAYEFHCYEPSDFTHQGFAWAGTEDEDCSYPDSEEVRASGLTWISAQYGNGVDVGADGWQYAETSIAKISKTVDILGVSLHVSGLGAGGKCYGDNLVIYEYDKQGELIRTIVCEDKDTAGNFSFWSDDGSGSGTVSTSVGYDDKRALLIEGVVGSANMTCVNILPVTGHTYKAAAQIKVENAEDGASVTPTIEMYAADSITGIDRVMLENAIVKNLEASAKADVPLFCGEFGAGIHCFEEDRGGEIWVSDMIDLLTLYGVGFSYHNYRSNSFGMRYIPDGASAERRNELLAQTFAEKLGGVYVPVEAPDDEKEVPEPAAEAVPEAPKPEVIPEETEAEEPKQAADAQSAVSSSEGTASVKLGKKGCGSMLGGGWIVTVCLSLAALACGRRKEE